MTTAARVTAWALAGLAVVLALLFAGLELSRAGAEGPVWLQVFPPFTFLVVAPVLGAVVATRQPRNAVGWLFIVIGGALAFAFSANAYGAMALSGLIAAAVPLPLTLWAATWLSVPAFAGLPLLVLLFPTGHPPSRGWMKVAALAVFGAALLIGSQMLTSRDVAPGIANPFAWREAAAIVDGAEALGVLSVLASLVLGLGSVVVRFRRADQTERQQVKWFLSAVAVIVPLNVLANLTPVQELRGPLFVAAVGSLVLLPTAAAIAILRYRLYDIDVLINRTLVYSAVTALLAGTYFGAVILIQAALRPFTSGSELAVAAATLTVVALFQPLRRRVQFTVDRRFYRSRYDAARTLDAFSARLRDQVELDAVRADLLGVVHDTIRPTHARLWLRR